MPWQFIVEAKPGAGKTYFLQACCVAVPSLFSALAKPDYGLIPVGRFKRVNCQGVLDVGKEKFLVLTFVLYSEDGTCANRVALRVSGSLQQH